MTFPQFIIAIGIGILTGFFWHWLIRNAVAGGIIDARKRIAKERDELKALKTIAERKQRPSKARNSLQSPSEGNQVFNR